MKKEKEINLVLWVKTHAYDVAAYSGLIFTLILFFIFSGGNLIYNLTTTLQTVAPYSIIALGAVFVYSMGNMDVSVGQQVGVYAILMTLISNRIGGLTGLLMSFVIITILALICGAFNGAVAVWLGLPSIVTSLFLMFFFGGAQLLLMESTGNSTIGIDVAIKPMDRNAYTLLLVALVVIVAIVTTYFFNRTMLGRYTKAIGANERTTAQAGANLTKWKVLAYMYFGATIVIGSYALLSRSSSAGMGTGSGFAMDIMVCLILGGMPLSGGMRSKVRSALIGTFTYTLLSSDLTVMGVDLNMINFVKAIVFLAIIFVTCRKKTGPLPR